MVEYFLQRFSENISKLSEDGNIYDTAAFAYKDICEVLDKYHCREEVFCAKYLKIGSELSNPNLFDMGLPYEIRIWAEKSNKLVEKVYETLKKCSMDPVSLEQCLNQLLLILVELKNKTKNYLDQSELTQEVLAYWLICVIDYYAIIIDSGKGKSDADMNLLNFNNTEFVQIYRKPFATVFTWKGKRAGIDDLDQIGINEKLAGLFFVSATSIPKETEFSFQIYRPDQSKLASLKRDNDGATSFRIAIVPFCQKLVTSFPYTEGSLFEVKHDEEYDEEYGKAAVDLLNEAIENGCHIVVFPEFMISGRILQLLRDALRYRHDNNLDSGKLLFVCAGTKWENGNNIGTLIDSRGDILVEKYKSNPYKTTIEGKEYMENLKHPGKKIGLLDFEGFGRVQLSVCRDVCATTFDSDHKKIFSLFHPDFVVVPAWSGSFQRGFADEFINMSQSGAVSVLGNCCEAITFMLKLKEETAKKRGEIFQKSVSAEIRGFTGVPANNENRLIKIACKNGRDEVCPVQKCLIMYELVLSSDEAIDRGEDIFRMENLRLISSTGTIINDKLYQPR